MYLVRPIMKPFLLVVDILGGLLFFWTKFRPFPKNVRKILVIRLDQIGDVIMTTPVFASLKNSFPNAEVHVLCRELSVPVIENNKSVDKIWLANPPWHSKKDVKRDWYNVVKKLRSESFDLVVELHADPRNIFLAWRVGGYRVGYGVRGFGFLLNKVVVYDSHVKQVVERNLDVIRSFSLRIVNNLELSVRRTEAVNFFMEKSKIKNFILIHPVSGRYEKNWTVEGWRSLIISCVDDVVVTGSDSDRELIDRMIVGIKMKVVNAAGLFKLNETFDLISRAEKVISVDTFVVHVCAALKKPLVAIYGPTDPKLWGPYSLDCKIVRANCVCGDTGFGCRFSNPSKCMSELDPNVVVKVMNNG
jgi:lipopolysaccharide heptosyltransferase II